MVGNQAGGHGNVPFQMQAAPVVSTQYRRSSKGTIGMVIAILSWLFAPLYGVSLLVGVPVAFGFGLTDLLAHNRGGLDPAKRWKSIITLVLCAMALPILVGLLIAVALLFAEILRSA